MRALFATYRNAFEFPGGGEVIFKKCKEHLEKKGVDVGVYDFENKDFSGYDIVHNFSVVGECLETVKLAKKQGKKVAVHTIYWPQGEYALKGDIPFTMKVKKWLYTFLNKYNLLSTSKMREIIENADILFPNSEEEGKQLMNDFRCNREKIHVVHDGVDERFFAGSAEEFFDHYNLKDFVLYVGRIEPRKNVLTLIRAMNETNLQLVIIGDYNKEDSAYYGMCREIAENNVHFLGRIDHESSLLVSAYYAAKVLALPSWYETPGIVAMEAGAAGCNIVITNRGCTQEYFGELADYVRPDDVEGIKSAVEMAFNKERNTKLRGYIKENFSWGRVAEEIIEGYRKALN